MSDLIENPEDRFAHAKAQIIFREYIESEVESKVRYIHQYYEDQFKTVNKERMSALAQLIKAKGEYRWHITKTYPDKTQ